MFLPKRLYFSIRLHGVTFQKTVIFSYHKILHVKTIFLHSNTACFLSGSCAFTQFHIYIHTLIRRLTPIIFWLPCGSTTETAPCNLQRNSVFKTEILLGFHNMVCILYTNLFHCRGGKLPAIQFLCITSG
jgi:hypothetical protein